MSSVAFVGIAFIRGDKSEASVPGWFALSVCGYCVLQLIPIPFDWLEVIAASNAEVWRESLVLVNSHPPKWASISIDPGATLRDALKWAYYAAVLFLVTRVVHRQGLRAILWAIFGSASAVAIVTLAHGALGADRVYGIFARSFTDDQWALSPLVNSNNLAGYMNLGFFIGVALFVESKSLDRRLLVGLSMAIMAMISLTSGSRGAVGSWVLGVACVGIFMIVRARSRRSPRQPAVRLVQISLLPIAVALLVFVLIPEMAMRNLGDKNIDKLHMVGWVVPMIRDYPWFGVGAGAFETGFQPYRVREDFVVWTHPENIITGWLTEFGLPVTLALIAAWIVPFWKARRGRITILRSMALIAVATWFLHNLVDLAVTVPGVFASVVALLGALSERRLKQPEAPRSSVSSSVLRPLLVAGGCLLVATASTFGIPAARTDRVKLHNRFEQLRRDDQASILSLRNDIEAAIRRHPGDAYLFRLRAAVASSTNEQRALSWLGRALDLDLINPDAHFLLAHELQRLGALKQALLELRLTAERSPHMTRRVASKALSWTTDASLLERTVPNGARGAPLLLELARHLPLQSGNGTREAFLTEATRRNPNLVAAQLTLAQDYSHLQKINPARCAGRKPSCLKSLQSILAALSTEQGMSARELTHFIHLKADLTALSGSPADAVAGLLDECPRFEGGCLERAVLLSAEHSLSLENPTRYLLAVTCPGDDTCAPAHRVVAQAHARASNWVPALHHYRQAAEHSRKAEDSLAAARVALRARLLPEARRSLDEVRNATPSPTSQQRAAAQQLERQLSELSRVQLLHQSLD